MSKFDPAQLKLLLKGLEEAANVLGELKNLVTALHVNSDSDSAKHPHTSLLHDIKEGVQHLLTKVETKLHPHKADTPEATDTTK